MATVDRALGLLRLFTDERVEWTVDEAARALDLSQSTAYEYVRSLVDSGLLSSYRTGQYVIGPAVIELDRQTRRNDPLIHAAGAAMDLLHASSLRAPDDVTLLCRVYQQTVMCIDQRGPAVSGSPVSYERGRPMPMDRGAASKVILASLPPRALRRFYDQRGHDDRDWTAFRKSLREIRKAGLSITHGELDVGRVGISAPVFAGPDEIVGSIGVVLTAVSDEDKRLQLVADEVTAAGRNVTTLLSATRAQH